MNPKIYAIVLNWNGLDDTLACLRSMVALGDEHLEVVVVDNGSAQSPRPAIAAAHPTVTVLENPTNRGYAGGNNVGIAYALDAGADLIWVLNNDTIVSKDSLVGLVAAAERHPRAAAIGGRVLRTRPAGTLWVTWGRVTWLQSLIELVGHNRPDGPAYDGERRVDWIPGCSILFRAAALREVGSLEEEYFAYHEDVEWAARAREKGWEIWYTGSARIEHAVHGSSGGDQSYVSFRKYLSARNSVLYARRHGTRRQRALMATAILVTLPFQYVRRRLRGEQEGILLKIRGWRDALAGRPIPLRELGLLPPEESP